MSITPLPLEIYRHQKTGRLYRIVCIASVEATLELVVVYQSEQDGRCWTRPLNEFIDRRFEIVEEARP
ncbi:DUF1653 domain-containing protein [Armatimonas sp.]|uniref:DUF1653 domain-containing protein n=1 Tax=Armatimonas sp. TaxID=1872638 RepID=UPI00286B0B01|nr:DUF1653 domain-containing protein [Armatimonas sp.]